MKRIRVLEIISGFAIEGPLGGIERFGIELSQALDQNFIEPIVCGMWAYGTPYEHGWVERLNERGVQAFIAADWHDSSPYISFKAAYQGTKAQVNEPIDIIHSHCQFGDPLAMLIKRRLQAKALIRTVHNEREWGKRPFRRALLTNGLYPKSFDIEIGVAQQVVDNLDKRPIAQFFNKKALKKYNAINTHRFTKEVNKEYVRTNLNLPSDASIIGTIGRLTEQKGYTILLNAVAPVLKENPDTYFIVVGTGHLESHLQNQTKKLGIEHNVRFLGARNDIEDLLPTFDIFVNSSLWEGLPTVIMESMLAKVPVLATAVGGNEELIKDTVTGFLVKPDDALALAQKINDILDMKPNLIKKITNNAQQFIKNNFSIATVAQQHVNIYQQVIG